MAMSNHFESMNIIGRVGQRVFENGNGAVVVFATDTTPQLHLYLRKGYEGHTRWARLTNVKVTGAQEDAAQRPDALGRPR